MAGILPGTTGSERTGDNEGATASAVRMDNAGRGMLRLKLKDGGLRVDAADSKDAGGAGEGWRRSSASHPGGWWGWLGDQLKPSKWPFKIRSPMGDGARRGRPSATLRVADRRGLSLRPNGITGKVGLTAELGGTPGGERLPSGAILRERRRRRPCPRSLCVSGRGGT